MAFVGLGGAIVLSNYIPKANNDYERLNIFYTYSVLTTIMYCIFVIVLFSFPNVSNIFIGEMSKQNKIISIFIMAPFFVAMIVISYLLTSLLEARISNIMSKINTLILPLGLIGLYFINKDYLLNNITLIVLIVYSLSNVISIVIGLIYIRKNLKINTKPKLYIPNGFVSFTTYSFIQAIFTFLYRNIDKMFLLTLGNLNQLGFYQAIIAVLTAVEYLPSLLGNVTIPYFSSIIKHADKKIVVNSYEKIVRYMLLFLVSFTLGVMAISEFIMLTFGEEYLPYKYLLVILLVSKCTSSLGFTNTPMLIVIEENRLRFINSLMQIAIQFTITYFTINKIGILGVVLGRVIGVNIAQIMPQLIIKYKSGYDVQISRAYFAGAFSSISYGAILITFDLNLILSITIGICFWIAFIILGSYSLRDIRSIKSLMFAKIDI